MRGGKCVAESLLSAREVQPLITSASPLPVFTFYIFFCSVLITVSVESWVPGVKRIWNPGCWEESGSAYILVDGVFWSGGSSLKVKWISAFALGRYSATCWQVPDKHILKTRGSVTEFQRLDKKKSSLTLSWNVTSLLNHKQISYPQISHTLSSLCVVCPAGNSLTSSFLGPWFSVLFQGLP